MPESLKSVQPEQSVSSEDVERVLAVERLLLAVLTPEDLETFRILLQGQRIGQNGKTTKGNASSP